MLVRVQLERQIRTLNLELFHELSVLDSKQSQLSEQVRALNEERSRHSARPSPQTGPVADMRVASSSSASSWLAARSLRKEQGGKRKGDDDSAQFRKSVASMVQLAKGMRTPQKLFWCTYYAQHYMDAEGGEEA